MQEDAQMDYGSMTEDQILEDELLLDLMDEKNHSSVH
jgi:hypothetical protein